MIDRTMKKGFLTLSKPSQNTSNVYSSSMLFTKFINSNETIIDQEVTNLLRAAESYFVNWCFLVGWWNIFLLPLITISLLCFRCSRSEPQPKWGFFLWDKLWSTVKKKRAMVTSALPRKQNPMVSNYWCMHQFYNLLEFSSITMHSNIRPDYEVRRRFWKIVCIYQQGRNLTNTQIWLKVAL